MRRALFEEALENGVCYAPGDVFSADIRYGDYLRLSCGHPWDARIEHGVTTRRDRGGRSRQLTSARVSEPHARVAHPPGQPRITVGGSTLQEPR